MAGLKCHCFYHQCVSLTGRSAHITTLQLRWRHTWQLQHMLNGTCDEFRERERPERDPRKNSVWFMRQTRINTSTQRKTESHGPIKVELWYLQCNKMYDITLGLCVYRFCPQQVGSSSVFISVIDRCGVRKELFNGKSELIIYPGSRLKIIYGCTTDVHLDSVCCPLILSAGWGKEGSHTYAAGCSSFLE